MNRTRNAVLNLHARALDQARTSIAAPLAAPVREHVARGFARHPLVKPLPQPAAGKLLALAAQVMEETPCP